MPYRRTRNAWGKYRKAKGTWSLSLSSLLARCVNFSINFLLHLQSVKKKLTVTGYGGVQHNVGGDCVVESGTYEKKCRDTVHYSHEANERHFAEIVDGGRRVLYALFWNGGRMCFVPNMRQLVSHPNELFTNYYVSFSNSVKWAQ